MEAPGPQKLHPYFQTALIFAAYATALPIKIRSKLIPIARKTASWHQVQVLTNAWRRAVRYAGIGSKTGIFAFALVIVTAVVIGTTSYYGTNAVLVRNELEQLGEDVRVAAARFQISIGNLENDTLFLANVPSIQKIFWNRRTTHFDPASRSLDEKWRQELAGVFAEFLGSRKEYIQIRLLDATRGANELVRVDKKNDLVTITGEKGLLARGDRPYFVNGTRLAENEVLLSRISLHRDRGEIQEPHQPVIRAITPVYTDNKRLVGIVSVTMDMQQHLSSFGDQYDRSSRHFVTNERGEYLYHADISKIFSFDFDHSIRLQDGAPELAHLYDRMSFDKEFSGHIKHNNQATAVHIQKVYFDTLDPFRFIAIIKEVDYDVIVAGSRVVRNRNISLVLLLIGVAGALTVLFSRMLTQPLHQITRAAETFASDSRRKIDLPTRSNDEIGILARAFSRMQTEREKAETALFQKTSYLELLQAITSAANQAATPTDAMHIAVNMICRNIEWPVGHVFYLGKSVKEGLVSSGIWHIRDPEKFKAFKHLTEQTRFQPGIGLPGRVLVSGKPAWVEDVREDSNFPGNELGKKCGVVSGFAFPVLAGNEVLAVLEFLHEKRMERDEQLIEIMGNIGTQLGRAMERKRAEESLMESRNQLQQLANYDQLTGLPNRLLFYDRLNQVIARAPWNKRLVAVMFVDLDRFKIVNDTMGHEVGDALLRQAASRMKDCLRSGDTVARYGGDEFVILLQDLASQNDIPDIARKVVMEMDKPFVIGENEFYVTASIGISLFPDDASDADTLITNADMAMYHTKKLGKNHYQFYSQSMNTKDPERLALENGLRQAQKKNEFFIVYQPKLDLRTGKISGAEALLRWKPSGTDLVGPDIFVPALEDLGLITPVGEWVLETVCDQILVWQEAGIEVPRIAINISARQFRYPYLLEFMQKLIKQKGINPGLLEMELTESILLEDLLETQRCIEELANLGIHMTLDDFGTGYSSLSYLKKFPMQTIKIDRSFIRDITTDPEDAALSQAIIAIAHSLNLRVVAEGVETEAQLNFIQKYGCDELQGYLFNKPLETHAFRALLENPAPFPLMAHTGKKRKAG